MASSMECEFADGKCFNMPWVRLYWPDSRIQVGRTASFVRHFAFYSLSSCRSSDVVDENGPVRSLWKFCVLHVNGT